MQSNELDFTPAQLDSRDFIKPQQCTLQWIIRVLQSRFERLDQQKLKNVVLFLGETGSGISTLIYSMKYGHKSLYMRELHDKITINVNEKTKDYCRHRHVIDKTGQSESAISIGHIPKCSETFSPVIVDSNLDEGLVYVDMPGLNDTGGDLIEFVNQFTLKYLFSRAEKIRIVIPIINKNIFDYQGRHVKDLTKIVQAILKNSSQDINDSILPVLTNVDPADDDFDLEKVKKRLLDMLRIDVVNFAKSLGLNDEHVAKFLDEENATWAQVAEEESRNPGRGPDGNKEGLEQQLEKLR